MTDSQCLPALSDQVYIVTGGSRGFGFAVCQLLLQRGARVAMLARDEQQLEQSRQQLADQYGDKKVYASVCDATDSHRVNAVFGEVKQHFGQLNGLVNNAGLARPSSVEQLLDDDVMLQINTNFVGTVFCCRAAIPLLRQQDNPRIINISSASAWHYDEMMHLSVYAATKAAVERFTRDLRLECQSDSIGVTCIRPGAAWTSFSDGWSQERLAAGVQAWTERFGSVSDSGMEVSHVAEAICFALAYPPGVAIDLLEVRPNSIEQKGQWD